MGWLQTLLTGGVDKIVEKTGEAIDRLVTSDEEKLQLRNELIKIQLEAQANAQKQADETEIKLEEELTKRHAADMGGDDPWAKKIRPASLAYLLCVVTVLALTDGNLRYDDWSFTVDDSYISLFQSLLLLAFGFYFGSRGIEKIAGIIWGSKK